MGSAFPNPICANDILPLPTTGKFEYAKLAQINGIIAPLFFIFIVIFSYLVLGNLVIAILNDAYNRVAKSVDDRGYYWMQEYQYALNNSVSAKARANLDMEAKVASARANHVA